LIKRGDVNLDEFTPVFSSHGQLPYFILPARGGHLVSRYGFGAPAAAAPVFAIALAVGGGRISENAARLVAKLASSFYVAGATVLLILAASRLGASRAVALTIGLCYAFATAAFSVASQALWQHGPAEFFLALGYYLLSRASAGSIAASGAAFAGAVVCRPGDVPFALGALLYVLHLHRRQTARFVLWAAPIAFLQFAYGMHYFGAPWRFGQDMAAPPSGFWSGGMLEGFAGQLLSPSRGLFIYSPFFLFLFWHPKHNWLKTPAWLRYQLAAVLALLLINAQWWQWYGGWSYGYRMLADAAPALCLALLPILELAARSRGGRIAFVCCALAALAIHLSGAYSYDASWDMNVDVERNPQALWWVRDGQLAWQMEHLRLRR
jgi:hypothetical protein